MSERASTATVDESAPLARYTRSMRRQRLVYFSIVAVIVVVLGVVVAVAWSRGEVANTTLKTVGSAPASLPVAAPVVAPKAVWQTSDHTAIGAPQWGGTVVVFGRRTVRGIDARSGGQTWSYTRSNRTLCTAAQLGGFTLAIYEIGGNCDQVTALDSGTGERRWTRTLDIDGMPVNGHPTYQVTNQGGNNTLLVTTKSVIYALDPSSGYNRWTYSHYGCSITGAAIGTNGALISQNCTAPRCGQLKFCGRGPQLFLRNAYDGRDDKSKTNPDKITWNLIGNSDVPASADGLISSINTSTGTLDQLDSKTGASRGTLRLAPAPSSYDLITASQAGGTEIVWVDGVTYALQSGSQSPVWTASTPGPPTVVSGNENTTPALATARITVPTATGVRLLDGNDGRTAQGFDLTPVPPVGSVAYPLGAGILVSAPSGSVAYA